MNIKEHNSLYELFKAQFRELEIIDKSIIHFDLPIDDMPYGEITNRLRNYFSKRSRE